MVHWPNCISHFGDCYIHHYIQSISIKHGIFRLDRFDFNHWRNCRLWELARKTSQTIAKRLFTRRPGITLVPHIVVGHGHSGFGNHLLISSGPSLHRWHALCPILLGLTHRHDYLVSYLHSALLPIKSLYRISIFRKKI